MWSTVRDREDFLSAENCVLVISIAPWGSSNPCAEKKKITFPTLGSYQGFNASIGTYGGVIDSIVDSQSRVKELRMDLKNSKESLRLRHADLVQLYNKSQQYKDMIEMLDEM